MTVESSFTVKAYSQKELIALYDISHKTFKKWIGKINDLGGYDGKKYTPNQVKKIVDHVGTP